MSTETKKPKGKDPLRTFRMGEDWYDFVEAAKRDGTSASAVLREAAEKYLRRRSRVEDHDAANKRRLRELEEQRS